MMMLVENASHLHRAPTLKRRVPSILSTRVIADSVIVAYATILALLGTLIQWSYAGLHLNRGVDHGSDVLVGCLIAALFLLICLSINASDFAELQRFGRSTGKLLAAFAGALVIFLVIAFLTKTSAQFSRAVIFLWAVSGSLALAAAHGFVSGYLRRSPWLRRLAARHVAVVCGNPTNCARFVDLVAAQKGDQLHLIGVFHADGRPRPLGPRGAADGSIDDLLRYAAARRVDEVYIAMPWHQEHEIRAILDRLDHLPVDIKLCPDRAGYSHRMLLGERVAGVPVATLRPQPIRDWGRLVKSGLDLGVSLALLVLLAPLLALIAVSIRVDSPGPVLFRQPRHGFNHDVFDLYKFRTMRHDPGAAFVQARTGDGRVTRVGRWLRRTSLDELPQLVNVLRGEMSLVGPRPHPVDLNAAFMTRIQQYASRHRVKPGITGWAQVNGWRGATDTEEKMAGRVSHDLHYIDNWSLVFDLKILVLTLISGFTHENAY